MDTINTLFGRRKLMTTTDVVTPDNIIATVNQVIGQHCRNLMEEEFLYWYRRGLQPILQREKTVRPDIKNTVVENHADEIVSFKNGYFMCKPITYISRTEDTEKVKQLNEYLYRSGKAHCDNEIVNWFHTVGLGVLYVEANDDERIPVKCYCLDPRQAFVVYSMKPGNRPVMGINMIVEDKTAYFDVFTESAVYRLKGTVVGRIITDTPIQANATELLAVEPNILGRIPIIEYRYNSANMGAFESAISLLEALNGLASNRMDGVEQFVQSLMVVYNGQFEEGTTSTDIAQSGLVYLKSVGDAPADIKIISEQLDQTQVQKLVDWTYQQVMSICGMPTSSRNGTSVANTSGSAALAVDGWYQADTVARNTEDLFRQSNAYFDEIFTEILRRKNLLDIDVTEFECQFTRTELANIQSKAQACQTMLAAGLSPELAFSKSGISNDPVNDVELSKPYLYMIWGNPNDKQQGEAVIEEVADDGAVREIPSEV